MFQNKFLCVSARETKRKVTAALSLKKKKKTHIKDTDA